MISLKDLCSKVGGSSMDKLSFFLDKKLHIISFYPGVKMGSSEFNAGINLADI